MFPVYPASVIRQWDEYTIKNEPIESIDLMERAATACAAWIVKHISPQKPIAVICGNGNNGGDGLAIARLLYHYDYNLKVFIKDEPKRSADNELNLQKLKDLAVEFIYLAESNHINFLPGTVIIDCIFGTGLDRPVEGFWKDIINSINKSGCRVISIDIPSGLASEPMADSISNKEVSIIKAATTLTFQTTKLSMLIPGWGDYCGKMEVLDIGLSSEFIDQNNTTNFFVTLDDIRDKFKRREIFSHKGTYGHALLIAGDKGKCGAAILSSKACIKSGAGLVTVMSDSECALAIHAAIPEVMVTTGSELMDIKRYSAIGIGPGIGTETNQVSLLKNLLKNTTCPILLDADALTILASNPDLSIPVNTILTPHPKEFDRLAGDSLNAFERLNKASKMAKEKQCIIVLKGAYTAVCSPDGKVFFNSTGNPGMATAGSGDALTGIITAFLAQGYNPVDAAIMGVYVHGKSGDIAASQKSVTGLIASDIIENLYSVFKILESD